MRFLKKHYHWVIVAVVLLQLFVYGGLGNTFANLHVIPVSEALGISRGEFSLSTSAKGLFAMFSTFISGFFISKFGSRVTTGCAMLFLGFSYYLLAFHLNSYPLFFLYCAMVGFGGGLCGSAISSKVVTNWFHKHRGLILGIVSSATTLGGSALGILQPMAMERYGTYKASFALGAILLIIGGIAYFLFMRNTPQEMGLVPYGDGEEVIHKKKRVAENVKEGLSFRLMIRRPSFYLMCLCIVLFCSTTYIVTSVLVPHLIDQGFTLTQATAVNSYKHLLISLFKLVIGALCDRIGPKMTLFICVFFNSVGLVLLTLVGGSLPFAYVTATVLAIGSPVVTVIPPLLVFILFGHGSQAQYTGIFLGMVSLSSMLSGLVANNIFDLSGSYDPAFLGVAGIGALLMTVLFPLLFKLVSLDEKKEAELALAGEAER